MTDSLHDYESVFADTSLFCNILRALPKTALLTVLDYVDASLKIVTDVNREMNGLCRGAFPGLAILKTVDMLEEYLRGPPVHLDPDIATDVALIAEHSGLFTPDPDRPKKNWGEIATVLMAARTGAAVLLDDREGRGLARRRKIPSLTTRDLVVEMSRQEVLTADEGHAVWAVAASSRCSRAAFEAALASGG